MSFPGDLVIGDGLEVKPTTEGHELPPPETQELFCTKDTGYRGFWHGQTPTDDEYVFKYSGGLGTYCAKHYPFSFYAPQVNRTYFCWGGTPEGSFRSRTGKEHSADTLFNPGLLHHMVSWYDHETGEVPRPTILMDKWCGDAHDNPVISIDIHGHIWIFSPSHGPWTTPSYIFRSRKPWSIDSFETVRTDLFSYPQIHNVSDGFLMPHTMYTGLGRTACFRELGPAGEPGDLTVLAHIGQGHYQVSTARGDTVASAFNYHPDKGGLEARTNLYYVESSDRGRTWTGPAGEELALPLRDIDNPALLRDYAAEGWLVYMKDIQFDAEGCPMILFIRSRGNLPGPQNGPRIWTVARRHVSGEWTYTDITQSDSNYDSGSLDVSREGVWRLIAPTEPGPQPGNPGGEVAVWESTGADGNWEKVRDLTGGSARNHTYVRRTVQGSDQFAFFWADGNPRKPSASALYFTDRDGTGVWKLPERMTGDMMKPERVR